MHDSHRDTETAGSQKRVAKGGKIAMPANSQTTTQQSSGKTTSAKNKLAAQVVVIDSTHPLAPGLEEPAAKGNVGKRKISQVPLVEGNNDSSTKLDSNNKQRQFVNTVVSLSSSQNSSSSRQTPADTPSAKRQPPRSKKSDDLDDDYLEDGEVENSDRESTTTTAVTRGSLQKANLDALMERRWESVFDNTTLYRDRRLLITRVAWGEQTAPSGLEGFCDKDGPYNPKVQRYFHDLFEGLARILNDPIQGAVDNRRLRNYFSMECPTDGRIRVPLKGENRIGLLSSYLVGDFSPQDLYTTYVIPWMALIDDGTVDFFHCPIHESARPWNSISQDGPREPKGLNPPYQNFAAHQNSSMKAQSEIAAYLLICEARAVYTLLLGIMHQQSLLEFLCVDHVDRSPETIARLSVGPTCRPATMHGDNHDFHGAACLFGAVFEALRLGATRYSDGHPENGLLLSKNTLVYVFYTQAWWIRAALASRAADPAITGGNPHWDTTTTLI